MWAFCNMWWWLCTSSQCCCCHLVHGSSAFHEQRSKNLFLFCPQAKNSRCPKGSVYCNGLHKKAIGYSKPMEMLMDPCSCVTPTLDMPLLLSHSQRTGFWRSNVTLPQLPPWARAEGMSPLPAAIFTSCALGCKILQLLQVLFTACPSTHY